MWPQLKILSHKGAGTTYKGKTLKNQLHLRLSARFHTTMADFSIDALNVFGEIIPHPELPGHLDVPSPSRGILLRTTKPVWTIGRGDGSLNSVAIKVMSTQLNTSAPNMNETRAWLMLTYL